VEVTIRCYGGVADAVGERSLARVVEPGSTVGDVVDGLNAEFEGFDPGSHPEDLVYRVNGGRADADTRLGDGDAVVISGVERSE
jgi:molybdopterin converting factor small subunit